MLYMCALLLDHSLQAIKAVMKKAVSEWQPPVIVAVVSAAAVETSAAAAVADNNSAAAAAKAANKDKLQLQIACCSVS
jgi:t-SNARE complex subunit (syntaxin)